MSLRITSGILAMALLMAQKPSSSSPAAKDSTIQQAIQAERDGDFRRAYLLWAKAAARDPRLWTKAKALEKSLDQVAEAVAAASPEPAPVAPPPEDPEAGVVDGDISFRDIQEARQFARAPRLAPVPGPQSVHIRGDVKAIYEAVARKFGYVAVLDRDLAATAPAHPIRLDVDQAAYDQILHMAEAATNTFIVAISSQVMLIAQDTTVKRNEFEPNVSQVFLIPQKTSVQDATEILMTVQQTLEIRRAVLDPVKRLILLRGPQARVQAAKTLLGQLSGYKTQVGIEMELLTFDENKSRSWGLGLQTSSNLVNFGKAIAHATFANPGNLTSFLTFGGGSTFLGLGLTSATLFASATESEATSLTRTDTVVIDGQTANFHIGEKYPIITSQYSGVTTTGQSVAAPIPAFTFEDLGLVLKVTPWVHGSDEVTLDIDAEFKAISGSGVNGIPIINNRKFQSKVRLMTSEWAIVTGLMSRSDARTISGLPGLSSLPVAGTLFRDTTLNHDFSEALILIKPRIMSMPPSERVNPPFWIGTDTKPRTML